MDYLTPRKAAKVFEIKKSLNEGFFTENGERRTFL